MNRHRCIGLIGLIGLTGLVPALATACEGAAAARVVDANQEPVAVLELPVSVPARTPVEISARKSTDVDGAIVGVELSFGDGTAPEVSTEGDLVVTHAWDEAGLYDVELAVTDDGGLTGRARVRVVVEPPPDANAPTLHELVVTHEGTVLEAGARVTAGAPIQVDAHATDAEGNLESVLVEAGAASASLALEGADARGSGTVIMAAEGAVTLRATALDAFGNRSAPRELPLLVVGPDADTDADGLVDVDDPAPDAFNGVEAEVFLLEEDIPTDLVGNQRAEIVLERIDDLEGATQASAFPVTRGWLAVNSTSSTLDALAGHAAAPAVNELFAVSYRGTLHPPAEATHVEIEVGADDVGVVFLDGTAVASANGEFATDFLRFSRVPAVSSPIALAAGQGVPVRIVVANGTGPWGWSIRFRFLADGATIMNPEAVSQRQFSISAE